MTGLSFATSPNWVYLVIFSSIVWILLLLYIRSYKKNELKKQLIFGIFGLFLGSMADVIGTASNLWHFTDGDVPIIIFLIYFIIGMASYNFLKLIDRNMKD
jgi:drug/metabolite transporter (DMT)-like permease